MKWLRENGAGLFFAVAILFAVLLIGLALLGGPSDRSRAPRCYGTTGEYVGPDGRAVLNPYDSLCVPHPSASVDPGNGG